MPLARLAKHRFFRFFVVGSLGFCVDVAVFALILTSGVNPHLARATSFLVAVGITFLLNKRYTFQAAGPGSPALYLASQAAGLGINMAIFSLTVYHPARLPEQYYLGLAAGSIAAMALNYHMSKRYVFPEKN